MAEPDARDEVVTWMNDLSVDSADDADGDEDDGYMDIPSGEHMRAILGPDDGERQLPHLGQDIVG